MRLLPADSQDAEVGGDIRLSERGLPESSEESFVEIEHEDAKARSRRHSWRDLLPFPAFQTGHKSWRFGRREGLLRHSKRTWLRIAILGILGTLVVVALICLTSTVISYATSGYKNSIERIIAEWGQPGRPGDGLDHWPTDFSRDIRPIACHSHNDYWRAVPLYGALSLGCTSVEADVWLLGGDELLIGHDAASLTENRTLRSMYVDPLAAILAAQNPDTPFVNASDLRQGVFDTDPDQTLTLLIDLKTDGVNTWRAVVQQLEPLRRRNWLTYFDGEKVVPGPITVVGTGNTPFDELFSNTSYRDYFFDAPLDEMYEPASSDSSFHSPRDARRREDDDPTPDADKYTLLNSYYASVSFGATIGRVWRGGLSPHQTERVRGQLRGAHRRGLKARYWDLPDWPIGVRNGIWKVLMEEGVDMLNVDDLEAAAKQVWR